MSVSYTHRSVDTDSRGDYALPAAMHTGLYTLRMTKASLAIESWRDKIKMCIRDSHNRPLEDYQVDRSSVEAL